MYPIPNLACRAMLALALVLSAGCGDSTQTSPSKPDSAKVGDAKPTSVEPDGTRFDPAVDISAIPDGNWVCDMGGKVHYAAGRPGDGKCPVCSMKLVRKGHPADNQMGGRKMGGHDGHDGHDDHDHK